VLYLLPNLVEKTVTHTYQAKPISASGRNNRGKKRYGIEEASMGVNTTRTHSEAEGGSGEDNEAL
jgi:hypothetical protein